MDSSLDPHDLAECDRILRRGSKSFSAAQRLLPSRVRSSVAVAYAFCRVADDCIDEESSDGSLRSLHLLMARLDGVYAGRPQSHPVDRALAVVVREHAIPRAVFDALLEGFRWDLEGRAYESVSDLRSYCVRVAGTVGVLMTLLMGERRPFVLGRACDLGVAMQLTNIARDVGEDARAGRLYIPRVWMREVGIDAAQWLARPTFVPAIAELVARLLDEADGLYVRANEGIPFLPKDCRHAIRAARAIYADIGRVIANHGYDSVHRRAYTSKRRKLWLLGRSLTVGPLSFPRGCGAPTLPEARFLIEGA